MITHSKVYGRRDASSGRFVISVGEAGEIRPVMELTPDIAEALKHAIAVAYGDKCPCHRGQTYSDRAGAWEIER